MDANLTPGESWVSCESRATVYVGVRGVPRCGLCDGLYMMLVAWCMCYVACACVYLWVAMVRTMRAHSGPSPLMGSAWACLACNSSLNFGRERWSTLDSMFLNKERPSALGR